MAKKVHKVPFIQALRTNGRLRTACQPLGRTIPKPRGRLMYAYRKFGGVMASSIPLLKKFFTPEATAQWMELKETHVIGEVVSGKVLHQEPFGVFVDIGLGFLALLEVPEFEETKKIRGMEYFPAIGSTIKARILGFMESNRQIFLTQQG